LVCGDHTTAAYSRVGRTMALYTVHLAIQLHPNIAWHMQFKDFVALLIAYLQYLNQLNLPSTITPRYLTGLFQGIDCPLMQ